MTDLLLDAPAAAREQVEDLMARLSAVEAFAAVEHLFGVLPLADAFFAAGREIVPEGGQGALGLFTPTPALGWEAAAVEGEPSAGGLILGGEVRIASPAASGALVLARLAGTGGYRLAWIGLEGARAGWLLLNGAPVAPDRVSRPVALAELRPPLEACAAAWALAAAICAGEGARALRRAARTTTRGGRSFNTSQLAALGITEVEIESELAAVAARQHLGLSSHEPGRGLALATAAARALSNLAARTAELRDRMGLAVDGPLADDGAARALTSFLGGTLMLEGELARVLGIPEGSA